LDCSEGGRGLQAPYCVTMATDTLEAFVWWQV